MPTLEMGNIFTGDQGHESLCTHVAHGLGHQSSAASCPTVTPIVSGDE